MERDGQGPGRPLVMVPGPVPGLVSGTLRRGASEMSRGVLSEARPVGDWTEHAIMDVATGG
jgi:ribose transport system ATP-binding protein